MGVHVRRVWQMLSVMGLMLVLIAPVQATRTMTSVLTNAQGTVVATMDAAGNVTYTAAYRPYGKQQVGTPQPGPGYTGHVNDPDTGLVYMQARYYDPSGRFLSVDPVDPTAGNVFSFNRYAYAYDNPVINTDPTGNEAPCVSLNQACTTDAGYAQAEHTTAQGLYATSKALTWVDVNITAPLAGSGVEPAAPTDEVLAFSARALSSLSKAMGAADEAAPLLSEGAAASKAATLSANKIAGEEFEKKVLENVSDTHVETATQVTVQTQSGTRTRLDILARDAEGNIVCIECKSSATARLTPNQRAAFPEISRTGAIIVGRGKPGFPGGTQIPPSNVRIIRP